MISDNGPFRTRKFKILLYFGDRYGSQRYVICNYFLLLRFTLRGSILSRKNFWTLCYYSLMVRDRVKNVKLKIASFLFCRKLIKYHLLITLNKSFEQKFLEIRRSFCREASHFHYLLRSKLQNFTIDEKKNFVPMSKKLRIEEYKTLWLHDRSEKNVAAS